MCGGYLPALCDAHAALYSEPSASPSIMCTLLPSGASDDVSFRGMPLVHHIVREGHPGPVNPSTEAQLRELLAPPRKVDAAVLYVRLQVLVWQLGCVGCVGYVWWCLLCEVCVVVCVWLRWLCAAV